MFSVKSTAVYLGIPAGAWATWSSVDQSHLIVEVLLAVSMAVGIFVAIMWATDFTPMNRRRSGGDDQPATPLPFRPLTVINRSRER